MSYKYKAIIFDFDGVILDSVEVKTAAFAEMYQPYGKDVSAKVVKHHLAHGGVSRFAKFEIYHREFLGENLTRQQIDALALTFSKLVLEKVIASPFITGALELLKFLHDKMSLFVATGTPQNEIEHIVEVSALSPYFKDVYGSPETKVVIIKKLMEKYGYRSHELLFVGDAMTDYDAATEMSLDFVGVANNTTTFPKGTTLIQDLRTLLEIVK